MAVAVKNETEAPPSSPVNRLAVGSLSGAAYVLGSIGIVTYGIPTFWTSVISPVTSRMNSFVDGAMLLLAMVAGLVGLAVVGGRLVGSNPPRGLRAGVFSAAVGVILAGLLTWGFGMLLQRFAFGEGSTSPVGLGVTLAFGAGLLFFLVRAFFRPTAEEALIAFEDQGWFSAKGYKKNQGTLVRRGTIVGILIVAGCGVYTLLSHHTLDTVRHWELPLPFTEGYGFVLLPDVKFTVPLLLVAGSLWLAYRAVNFPTFADFLIATEAELNKVSWTTRKRLVQDTIVVLVTVVLFTVFLFFVDILWGSLLSSRYIGVLQVKDPSERPQAGKTEQQPW